MLMVCPRCRNQLVQASRFCPHCGGPLDGLTQQPVPAPVPAGGPQLLPRPRRSSWPVAVLFLALAGSAFYYVKATGLMRRDGGSGPADLLKSQGSSPTGDLLHAQGATPSGEFLRAYGSPAPSQLDKLTAEKIVMPPDILEYLKHVERCENYRVKMSKEQLSEALIMLTELNGLRSGKDQLQDLANPDTPADNPNKPTDSATRTAEQKRADWRTLEEQFASVSPPAECVKLRDEFQTSLHETGVMISEVLDALNQAAENPQAALTVLQNMRGTSGSRVDDAARHADTEVDVICNRYNTSPWFRITGDVGGGGLMGGGLGL